MESAYWRCAQSFHPIERKTAIPCRRPRTSPNSLFQSILPLSSFVLIFCSPRPISVPATQRKERFYRNVENKIIQICSTLARTAQRCFPERTTLYVQTMTLDDHPSHETPPNTPRAACYSATSRCNPSFSSLFRGGPSCCGLWPSSTLSAAGQTSFGFG